MSDERRLWLLLPRQLRALPADLAAVVAVVALTVVSVLAPVIRETPLRIVFGLAFVLFVPGYAFVAALFPEAGESPTADPDDPEAGTESSREGIDGIERVALAFGLSIAVVPLIGLVLNFTPWGIRLVPIVVSVSGFTLLATYVAARRRWALPAEERFRVPYRAWAAGAREELFDPDSRADAALNVLLVVSILLAASSVAYAVAVPKPGESFTELYILTHNESGDLVAADYPTNFTEGESKPVVVGISNHEHEAVSYTLVVELQEIRNVSEGPNATMVVERDRELQRFRTRLSNNQTWLRNYSVRPTMTGDRLRLAFLLYNESVPRNTTVDNAYREVHLWINVSADRQQKVAPTAARGTRIAG